MEPMLDAFRDVAKGLGYGEPRIPVVSNVTGALAEPALQRSRVLGRARPPDRPLRRRRPRPGQGANAFLEVGAGGVLTALARRTLDDGGAEAACVTVPALRKDRTEESALLTALATLHVNGVHVDWAGCFRAPAHAASNCPPTPSSTSGDWPRSSAHHGDVTGAGLSPAEHPLLGAATALAASEGVLFTGRLSLTTHPWLADHTVGGGMVLFPATGFLELAVRRRRGRLRPCRGVHPLHPAAGARGRRRGRPGVGRRPRRGRRAHREPLLPVRGPPDEPWTQHASGVLTTGAVTVPADAAVWPPKGAVAVGLEDFYDRTEYGPVFRTIRAVWKRGDEAFVEAALPPQADDAEYYGMHPALLDAAVQSVGFAGLDDEHQLLPFLWAWRVAARGRRPRGALPRRPDRRGLRLHRRRGRRRGPGALRRVAGAARARRDPRPGRPPHRARLAAPPGVGPPPLERKGDAPAARHAIAGVLGADGAAATLAGLTGEEDLVLVEVPAPADGADVPAAAHQRAAQALALAQEWLTGERFADARLVFVTRGAVCARPGDRMEDLAAAAVWGLVRAAQSENPARVRPPRPGRRRHRRSRAAAASRPALGRRRPVRGPRGRRPGRPARPGRDRPVPAAARRRAWRLDSTSRGDLDGLTLRPCPEELGGAPRNARSVSRCGPGGLNFRDVLNALGMYPGEAGPLGAEATGFVTAVGPEVTGVSLGDRVMGMVPGGLATDTLIDERFLARVPESWSETRTRPPCRSRSYCLLRAHRPCRRRSGCWTTWVPVVWGWRSSWLGTWARRCSRRRVSRSGGCCGSWGWTTLTSRPRVIWVSRGSSVRFPVVRGWMWSDALAGEFVDASLRVTAAGGRFLEMGKTDIRDPQALGDVRYRAFDLGEAGPERTGGMLTELLGLFAEGRGRCRCVSGTCVVLAEAFRFMSRAKHVGKIVLTMPARWDPEGTVLVTGGTGGLGREVARHLVVARGVLVSLLASCSGPAAEGVGGFREELAGLGAQVDVVACDVADRAAVAVWLSSVPVAHPLTAVVHTAGVLDDGVVTGLSPGAVVGCVASEGGRGVASARVDAGHGPRGVRDVLVGVGGDGQCGAGQLRRRQRLHGRSRPEPARGGPGRPRLGCLGTDQRHDRHAHRRGHAPDVGLRGPRPHRRAGARPPRRRHGLRRALPRTPRRLRLHPDARQVPPLLRNLVRDTRRAAATAVGGAGTADELTRTLLDLREDERLRFAGDLVRGEAASVSATPRPRPSKPNATSTTWASTPSPPSNCATASPAPPACGCPPPWSSTTRRPPCWRST
ncbi:SDR family NAD(P)-dependent oxidoreductase OS=Streptomyces rutgersensis OX=53451 GN=F0345_01405 PE=4 SV=1 [Streptomyces diastaticus subsp. diastaticus]